MTLANLFPPELTALRAAGLIVAAGIIAFAIARRRTLRNVDVLILLAAGAGLAIVSGTELTDRLLEAFSFQRGNGGRILGLAVFAIFVLFLMILRALSVSARNSREMSAVLEGHRLPTSSARPACRSASADASGSSSPPTTRPRTSATSSTASPRRSAGCATAMLVVDDGSRDRTGAGRRRARRRGGPPRDQPRRRRRPAYRLPADGRLRSRDRRHHRRRRPAPALRDAATGRAGARRRVRAGPRLARARTRRSRAMSPARWASSSSTGSSR